MTARDLSLSPVSVLHGLHGPWSTLVSQQYEVRARKGKREGISSETQSLDSATGRRCDDSVSEDLGWDWWSQTSDVRRSTPPSAAMT